MKLTIHRGCLLLGILVLLLQVGAAIAADTYPITGAITLADGRPVEDAAIYLDGKLAARSDRSGQYMVPAAPAGEHLLQPAKEGMTFVPDSIQVALPPEAAGVNFTAFAASGGIDSTSTLVPAPVDETPFQALVSIGKRWLNVIHQISLMMLVLSIGAFLALAARRLRSGEWSLGFLFPHRALVADQNEGAVVKSTMVHSDWEMIASGEDHTGIEEAFEVVAYAGAAEVKGDTDVVEAASERQEQPTPGAFTPGQPGTAAVSPHRRAPRIAVRRYSGPPRNQPATAIGTETVPASPAPGTSGSSGLLRQGMIDVRNGNLSDGEAQLRQVLQQDNGSAEAWFWLGIAKFRQGEVRTAERCFLQAQRLGHPHAAAALERTRRT